MELFMFSIARVCTDLSYRWNPAWICHELRTENESICPRLSKYFGWNIIDLQFFKQT